MEIKPITFREASDFINQYHRHHKATVGHKFSIGLYDSEKLVGVAVCGRPVSRHLDDGITLGKLPIGSWTNDVYTSWLVQNAQNWNIEDTKFHKMADNRYRGWCNEGSMAPHTMPEMIDFTPKVGMNVFMLEFFNHINNFIIIIYNIN